MTVVKRAWRGRGIAKSLKLAEIAWAHANGIKRLTASNEERNAPMLRLNESLGYRPAPGRVYMRGPAK
jgi:RimJ/RimL family protein N-acetyltransferase